MGLVNDRLKMYRVGLSKQMAAAHWYQIPVWAGMIGHINGTDGKYPRSVAAGSTAKRILKPTFKPIEVLTDFYTAGKWEIDIPIYYPLTEKPIYGDNPAMGNEESRKWAYNRGIINQVRKPILTRDGMMGELALTEQYIMQIMKNAKEELIDFNNRWQAYAPYDAITRGFSENILAPKAEGGFGNSISQRSHPNLYVSGYGKATWSNTAATYETNVNTAFDSLTNVSSDWFSTRTIKNAKILAGQLKIRPTQWGGYDNVHIMIIHSAQWSQLQEDENWKDAQLALTHKVGDASPIFTGVASAYLYDGVVVIVDDNCPGVWTSGDTSYSATRGTINYGNSNPLENPFMESDRKLAILVGASAVMCGHTKSLGFENMSWDYNNKKSECSYTVVGYNRSDIYDNDAMFSTTANLFKENVSSLVIGTYSPDTLSWS